DSGGDGETTGVPADKVARDDLAVGHGCVHEFQRRLVDGRAVITDGFGLHPTLAKTSILPPLSARGDPRLATCGPATDHDPDMLFDSPEVVPARSDGEVLERRRQAGRDLGLVSERLQNAAVANSVRVVNDLHVAVAQVAGALENIARSHGCGEDERAARLEHAADLAGVVGKAGLPIDVVAGVA